MCSEIRWSCLKKIAITSSRSSRGRLMQAIASVQTHVPYKYTYCVHAWKSVCWSYNMCHDMDILITEQRRHHQLHGEFIEISKNCHINRICCTRMAFCCRYMKYVFLEFLFPQPARATKVKSNKICSNGKKKIYKNYTAILI